METDKFLSDVTELVRVQRAEVEKTIAGLQQQITENKAVLRTFDSMLKAAGVTPATKKKVTRSAKPSNDTLQTVLDYIIDNPSDGGLTAKQISDATQVHRSSVTKALSTLRADEKIRPVKKVRGGGWSYAAWE